MPERRSSSVTSFMSHLHFSGKVIVASILFGFGLLLVGAILLIIATGSQKTPPLRENSEQTSSPMTYVGPGVMGVGGFFVIVGTVMCLFETRILRRRKNTDHESLVRSEIIPTGNTNSPRTENQESPRDVEATQVKTVRVECHHTEIPIKSSEKTPIDINAEEKDYDRQMSTSTDREQTQSFNASVYVDAFSENDNDENDNEEHLTSGSIQFSTPPETVETNASKMDGQSDKGKGSAQIIGPETSDTRMPAETEKESSLDLQRESENPQSVSESNERPLLVLKEDETPLSASSDSIPAAESSGAIVDVGGLTDPEIHPVHAPDSTGEPATQPIK